MNTKRLVTFGGIGCLGVIVLFIAGITIAGVMAKRALSADKVRPMVEQKLSAALGKPVTVGAIGFSFFPSPKVTASDIKAGSASGGAPSLSLKSVEVVPNIMSLFSGAVIIDRLVIKGLDAAVFRDRTGRWILPVAPPSQSAAPAPASTPSPVVRDIRLSDSSFRLVDQVMKSKSGSHEVAVVRNIEARIAVSGGTAQIDGLKGNLGNTSVEGSAEVGAAETILKFDAKSLDNRDLPALMAIIGMEPIEGLSISGKVPLNVELHIPAGPDPISATGQASVERLKLGTLEIDKAELPFTLAKGVVTIKPFTFSAYKGHQQGSVAMNLNRTPVSYTIRTSLEGLDVNAALSANTSAKDFLYGTAKASGNVHGAGFDQGALTKNLGGQADISVVDGMLKDFPLLAKINQALHITQGNDKDTKFDSLTGNFSIASGKAHTEDLLLRAGELTVTAKGDVNLNMTLDMKGTATFSPVKSKEITHSLSELSRLTNDKGELELPLVISGPISSPNINVDITGALKKGVTGEIKEKLKDKLKGLFGG
ncbi:MAG: AsmA family protein [Acidobacteria bacterium]|nr:AsmA family protein [Acidobacteriota bacterium]